MTIQARYPGKCYKCGQRIEPGDQIEWDKTTKKTSHINCPTPAPKPATEDAPYRIGGGSGYGCRGWSQGEVLVSTERQRENGYPEFLFVVNVTRHYIDEDGMSFGVGDDSGYYYTANCRAATEGEAAPLNARMAAAKARKIARARKDEIAQTIREAGERPELSDSNARGEKIMSTQNIYGGGDWFVLADDGIWYVQNNGSDGSDWAYNNVRTGGAGAIGWRIPADEALAKEIRSLAALLGGNEA